MSNRAFIGQRSFVWMILLCGIAVFGAGCTLSSGKADEVTIPSDNMLADFYWEGSPTSFPDGWEGTTGDEIIGETVFFEHDADKEHWTIRLVNDTERDRYIVVGPSFPAGAVGTEYIGLADAWVTGEGRARMFMEFLDGEGKRVLSTGAHTSENEWQPLTIVESVPANAVSVRLFVYSDRAHRGEMAFRNLQLMKY